GAGNRLIFDGTFTYTYDNEGNMTTKVGAGQTMSLTWDYRNRLIRVQNTGGALGTQDVTFTYDVWDRRIAKTTGPTPQWTVYDDNNPYADFSGGTLNYRSLYGNAIDQLFARMDSSNNTTW